jgi:hypothetical protein
MSHETPEYGTILLDGVAYPVMQTVGYQNLATFARKITSGDPSRESDDLISSKIWTGFAGGIGVKSNRDVADDGKLWFSTVWSRDPFEMTLNRRVVKVADIDYPLGDLAGVFYAATSTNVYAWNETTDAFGSTIGALTATPVGRGTAWNGNLYIPCGVNGYHRTNGITVDALNATIQAVGFAYVAAIQDTSLYAWCADGTLRSTTDGTNWAQRARISTSETPRNVVIWMDRNEQDTLFLITNRSVYAFDPTTDNLIRTRLSEMPPHPDNGLGAAPWRPGEDLYVSFGLQVMQYASGMSQIAPMGPDRRDGVPDELRGRVKDLCAEFNSLCALIEGVEETSSLPTSEFDPGHEDEPTEISASRAVSALMAYNGFGWHPLWTSGSSAGTAHWMCVSGFDYRLWWGWNGDLYTISLGRTFASPSQQFRVGEGDYEATGYLDTGWFDANMREFDKLASHFELNLENASATETVGVEYMTDWDADWTSLGTAATANDTTTFPFGITTFADGGIFSEGLRFRRIRFRLTWNRDPNDATQTPVVDSFALKHVRLPLSGAAYSLSIPLTFGPEGWGGRRTGQIKEDLDALIVKPGFVRLQHGTETSHTSHRVRLSYVQGNDKTGHDDGGMRNVNLVVIPLAGYEGEHTA